MPVLRQEEETTADTHVDEDIDETRLAAILAVRGLRKNAVTGEIEPIPSVKTAKPAEVCSCGSFVCTMLKIYGLPLPTFRGEIEPIYPQPSRDARALKLRKAGER
jgi:hypothetical protein